MKPQLDYFSVITDSGTSIVIASDGRILGDTKNARITALKGFLAPANDRIIPIWEWIPWLKQNHELIGRGGPLYFLMGTGFSSQINLGACPKILEMEIANPRLPEVFFDDPPDIPTGYAWIDKRLVRVFDPGAGVNLIEDNDARHRRDEEKDRQQK